MLRVEELRQGNFIDVDSSWYGWAGQYFNSRSIEKVQHITFNITTVHLNTIEFKVFQDYSRQNKLKDIKPVTLTEQWLIKFGFVKTDSGEFKLDNYYVTCVDRFKCWHLWKDYKAGHSCQVAEFSNVHTFQNLWFALNCKELTIKDGELVKEK